MANSDDEFPMPLPFQIKIEKRDSSENPSTSSKTIAKKTLEDLQIDSENANTSETEDIQQNLSLLSVSGFDYEMSDIKQLTDLMANLTRAVTQMADTQNRNLELEANDYDAKENQRIAQAEQRSIQLITAVATQCNKIEKFEPGKVIKFLHSVKHAYDLFNANAARQQIINFAKLQLPASAEITQKNFATYELFATAVRKQHRPAESVARMNQSLATVHQNLNESVKKYAERVRFLQEKLREVKMIDCEDRNYVWTDEKQEDLERMVNDQFVLGLKESLRPFVNADYANIELAVSAALKAESNAQLQKLLSSDERKFDKTKQNVEKKVDKFKKPFKKFEKNSNYNSVDGKKSDEPSTSTAEPVVQCEKCNLKGHTAATCRRKPAKINQAVIDEESSDDDAQIYMMKSESKNGKTGLWQTASTLNRK